LSVSRPATSGLRGALARLRGHAVSALGFLQPALHVQNQA
jgi:hypothetical protein